MLMASEVREIIVVGGGLAGLSAAIYLGRALRDTLIIDAGKSMARWEPDVQNYLGFPRGIDGQELIERARQQAQRYEVAFAEDEIKQASVEKQGFHLSGQRRSYWTRRLLLATGIYHIPPDLEGVSECLGHSLFFCKDCDAYRIRGKQIAVYGCTNEAVSYALAMLAYSPAVSVLTDGKPVRWDKAHGGWLGEYEIPLYGQPITTLLREDSQIHGVRFADGKELPLQALFTTRGDVYCHKLAKELGAHLDAEGQIIVDADGATNVRGLYAAGCVTAANCQMIIAAGQGAIAAQALNRDLLEESLNTHSLRRFGRSTTHSLGER